MLNKIKQALESVRPEYDFEESNDFILDGLLDSFDLVALVSELDAVFQISIEATEMLPENFNNLKSIECLIKKYVS